MKIPTVNGQQELITSCRCAIRRDRAYKRSHSASPAGQATERQRDRKQTAERPWPSHIPECSSKSTVQDRETPRDS